MERKIIKRTARKRLDLEERMKALRIYKKVQSIKVVSGLFDAQDLRTTLQSQRNIEFYKNHPKTNEPQPGDIIIPNVELILNEEEKPFISADVLKTLELLGECVCEALKRQQLFTQAERRRRIRDFAVIILRGYYQYWRWRVRYDYKFRFIDLENPQENQTLPVAVDLHEILCYCLKKLDMKNKEECESSRYNESLANSQHLKRDFEHPQVSSYNDVIKLLKPIKYFAKLCGNKSGIEHISLLEMHLFNIQNKNDV